MEQREKNLSRVPACAGLALGIALFFCLDSLAFRTGWYGRLVDPRSSLGSVALALDAPDHLPAGKTSLLVLGDSRISEGFSARIADDAAMAANAPYVFVNAAVPGTTPRVWYYLLRAIGLRKHHVAGVAIMLASYHDNDIENLADRTLDIGFVQPLLRLTDLADFPASFQSFSARQEAAEAVLLKGVFYQADLRDFLADPASRLRLVTSWRAHGYEWERSYAGRPGSLALPNTNATATAAFLSYASDLQRFRGRPPDNAASAAYRREWLGRIAALCQQENIRLFVFRIPRGPLHAMVDDDTQPTGVVAELGQSGRIALLPAALFDHLEHKTYFFDQLHLDSAGRAAFSTEFAQTLLAWLQPGTASGNPPQADRPGPI